MKTFFDQYNEFADACDIPKGDITEPANIESIKLARKLVREEWNTETESNLAGYLQNPTLENLVEVADGIADTIYVLCQLARSLGVPLNEVFNEVHRTNMAKVDPATGKGIKRADGKVLKPAGWKPPDIWEVLNKHHERVSIRDGKFGAENWNVPKVPKLPGDNADVEIDPYLQTK